MKKLTPKQQACDHRFAPGPCPDCTKCGVSYLDTLTEDELSDLAYNGCFDR